MDNGEVELSDQVVLSNPGAVIDFQGSTFIDTFLDDLLKNSRTCTHTHTCNPPGPDVAHTHTCYHTHTQVFASEEEDVPNSKQQSSSKSRRPSGNREAVRKYREKKKAHTAYLEEEVKKLRLVNQQLVRRLQGQALLEAEAVRLRSLLLDLRGKIDNELGTFPFQKPCSSINSFKEGDCGGVQSIGGALGLRCETSVPCLHPQLEPSMQSGIVGSTKMVVDWEGTCQPPIVNCHANTNAAVGQNMVSAEVQPDSMIPDTMDTMGTLISSQAE